MSARCPFCGSVKTEKTFNFNESTCLLCNCDFKVLDESRIRVFNSGSWSTFCENMAKEASNMFTRAEVVELTTRLFKEHASHIDEADILLTQVTQMAENLSYEVKAGVRDRHDFIQMVELAESVENAVKTLIEAGEFVPPSGFDIQDLSGEYDDEEDDSEIDKMWADGAEAYGVDDYGEISNDYYEEEETTDLPGEINNPVSNEDMEDSFGEPEEYDVEQGDYEDSQVPEIMGFVDEELEEDHLEDPINDIEDELRDVDDATFGVETQDDIRDVRDELRDVKDAIDDLWDAYRDSEEDDMGDDEMDMDMDMGGEDDLDLGLGDDEDDVDFGDEETEEDETDLEEPEGEGMAVGIGDEGEEEEEGNPFESRRRKGRKLSESTIGSPSKKNTDNLRNGYKTQKSNSVNVTHDDVEWDGEEEDDIPYTKDERTKGENQFGETKLSNAKGAVDSTPTIDDFTLEGKPSGTGLGIREGFNGFRVGDAIFISESRDEWVIQKLNGRKAKVKRGRTSTIVDLLDESVEHADRNLRHHREQELMKESYLAWERCEQQILDEGCIGGVCGLGDSGSIGSVGATMVSELSPVTIGGNNIIGGSKPSNIVDKSEIYKYIKDNDLHRTTRDLAFEELQYTFNNPIEEINQILDDAVLSNDEAQLESIDNMYHYNRVVERKYHESMRLNNAFRKIEESNESVRVKTLNESIKRNPAPVITRREEQNNDSEIENLGRTWLNQISEGLDDV